MISANWRVNEYEILNARGQNCDPGNARRSRGEFLDRLPVEVRWVFDMLESEYTAFDRDLDGLVEAYAIHTHEVGHRG